MHPPPSAERTQGAGRLCDAADLHAQVSRALASDEAVALDLSGVDGADVSFVQLMVSTSLTAERTGRPLTLSGLSTALRVALEKAGVHFDPALGRIILN